MAEVLFLHPSAEKVMTNLLQKKCLAGLAILCILNIAYAFGCSGQTTPLKEPQPLEKVAVIQTEGFVSFHDNPIDGRHPLETVKIVQKAAEQWMRDHPEYVVKDMSTSHGASRAFTFLMTLHIQKKQL